MDNYGKLCIKDERGLNMGYTVDVSKPVSNPLLVEALANMRIQKTKESSDQVIGQILKAEFLMPIVLDKEPECNEDGTATFQKETKLSFPYLINAKNQRYFMAFTDWNELHKWNPDKNQKTVVFRFWDYMELLAGENNEGASGFVINPFGGNLTLSKEQVVVIAGQGRQQMSDKE